jgi:hypothetical protein
MFSMKPRRALQISISLAALLILAACGGGDSSSTPPVVSNPHPPPTNPPPTDPGTVDIKLASAYSDMHDAPSMSTAKWPTWSYTGRAPIDGVACATSAAYHIHAMLSIYRDGVRLALTDNIGRSSCDYDMHTHDGGGVVHIETATPKAFKLGQFFSLWGQTLSTTEVAGLAGTPSFYVVQNEKITKVTTNPADITLEAHKEIVIVVGTPPADIPRWNWAASGL